MTRILYLGDEATAAGFRLAGVETRVTNPGEATGALREALAGEDECVLLSGGLVGELPAALLAVALQADKPLVAVIPDIRGEGQPADLAREVRDALGIDT